MGVGKLHKVAAKGAHFGLEQAHARGKLVRAQRIGAYKLSQMITDMGSRPVGGLLFKQRYGVTGAGQMQGTFAPGKAAAHHCYGHGLHTFSLPRSL